MAGRVEGKVALITGGGSGIGQATAILFAAEGAKVVVADYDAEGGQRTVKAIRQQGGEAVFVAADVSDPQQVEEMVAKAVATYGRLDCAFNNAGIEGQMAPTSQCSVANWERVIATNLTGVFLCMKAEIEQMIKQGKGAIVNSASIAGLVGLSGYPAYVASKFGVNGLTRNAALEYARSGIRVNAVCPGFIRTPMFERTTDLGHFTEVQIAEAHPVGRPGRSEEIAESVLWLSSEAASFVTGVSLPVDGGYVAQ